MSRDIPLPHPGIVLKEEFLEPMGLSVCALAKTVRVTRSRLNDICLGRQGITAAMALRLGRFFGVDPAWFMNMQVEIRPSRPGGAAQGGACRDRTASRGVRRREAAQRQVDGSACRD